MYRGRKGFRYEGMHSYGERKRVRGASVFEHGRDGIAVRERGGFYEGGDSSCYADYEDVVTAGSQVLEGKRMGCRVIE